MRTHKSHDPDHWTLPQGAGEVISATSNQAVILIDGFSCDPASVRAGAKSFAGVAVRGYDNTAGADGAVSCVVDTAGAWLFNVTGNPAPTRGAKAHAVDGDTVSADPLLGEECGTFIEPHSSGGWFVRLSVF